MSAKAARDTRAPGAATGSQWYSAQLERVRQENERLRREVEDLRRKIAERDQQIADSEKKIADSEKQLADSEKKIADSEKQLADSEKQLADSEKKIADSEKKVADAEKQITDLEHQLALRGRNSTTSSKPPSSDGLAGPERSRGRQREKSRRKPGGQKGHPGHWRPLVPLERVNQVIKVFPTHCAHCQQPLPDDPAQQVSEEEPCRYQVTELPRIEPHITEYQMYKLVCRDGCGKVTSAPLPEGVHNHRGPQLTALLAYMTVVCRVPRRLVRSFLEGVLEIPLSLGSTQKAWEEASRAVAEPYRELEQSLPQQPVLNGDETSSRTNGDKRWLWVFVAQTFVYYTIAKTRGTAVLRRLLGQGFAGILGCDRYCSYLKYVREYGHGLMQFCWAHFKRDLLGALETARSPRGKRFCREALALERQLFRLWYRFRGGVSVRGSPLTRQQLIHKSFPIQKKFLALGKRYRDCMDKEARNLAKALCKHHEKFFVFVEHQGVEPTNNRAERAERTAVQWRKISFGNRSAEGELAVARLLTVTRTCQMQQRPTLAYLSQAIQCYRMRQPVPSLLSQQT